MAQSTDGTKFTPVAMKADTNEWHGIHEKQKTQKRGIG